MPVLTDSEEAVDSEGTEAHLLMVSPTKKLRISDEAITLLVKSHQIIKPVVFDMPSGCQKFGVFASFYGGVGHVCEAWLEMGRTSLLYDIARNSANNLSNEGPHNDILQLLNFRLPGSDQSMVKAVGIDLPCSTWSQARRGGNGPPAVRDNGVHLFGFDGMRPADQKKVDDADQQLAMRWTTWSSRSRTTWSGISRTPLPAECG